MGKAHRPKVFQELEIKKTIHPNSRKAKQLSKKMTRDAKMAKKKASSNMKLQITGEKLAWFKDNCDLSLECYSIEDVNELIQRYIDRNSEELETIRMKRNIGHRKSRQHASREDLIRICRENEMAEFLNSGFETVDLTDRENFDHFKKWNGELRLIPNLKFKKFIISSAEKSTEDSVSTKVDDEMVVDDETS